MAESACGQDEVNSVFWSWLATHVGKMSPSFPLGISRGGPAKKLF